MKMLTNNGRWMMKYGILGNPVSAARWSANNSILSAYDDQLVAAYHFDAGGLITDSIGNNTLTNSGVTSEGSGKYNGCAQFVDTESDYFTIASTGSDFNFGGKMTFSAWVYFDTLATDDIYTIFQFPADTFYLGLTVRYLSGNWKLYTYFETDLEPYSSQAFNWNPVATTWYNLVMTVDVVGDELKWYVDGSLIHTMGLGGTTIADTVSMWIGTEYTADTRFMNGRIDEMYFWKGACLDQTAVTALYNTATGSFYDLVAGPETILPIQFNEGWTNDFYDSYQSSLKACWNFDRELTSDSIGNNTLTNNGVTSTIGKNNNGANFVAGSSQDLTIADNADLSPTTGLAFSAWVYLDTISGHRTIFYKLDSFFLIRFNDADVFTFRLYESDATIITLNEGALATGGWHHVCAIADSTAGKIYLYVDNVSQGTPQTYDGTIADNSNQFKIGSTNVGNYWDGKMDEICFFKNPVFASDTVREQFVTDLYNNGEGRFYRTKFETSIAVPTTWTANDSTLRPYDSSLVAYWKMEDESDSIGSHTWINQGSVTFTAGKNNNAATFDGSTNWLHQADSADWYYPGDFTISMWIKRASTSGIELLYYHGQDATANPRICVQLGRSATDNNIIWFHDSTDGIDLSCGTAITDTDYHHIVISRISTTLTVYLDGSSDGTATYTAPTNIGTELRFSYGRGSLDEVLQFDGQMDEVGIWKGRGFTSSDVTAMWNSGTGSFYTG